MTSAILSRALLLLSSGLAFVVLVTATTEAAEPSLYRLPDATHATSLGVAQDGTVWFVPSRGSEWKGESESIVGSLSPAGNVSEHEVAGFGPIDQIAVGADGEIWVAGVEEPESREDSVEVGRLSPSGVLEQRYVVGLGQDGSARINRLTVIDGTVWFINHTTRRTTIEQLSAADGAVRRFGMRPRCSPTALAAGAGGVLWFTEACPHRKPDGESVIGRGNIGRISPSGSIARQRITAIGRPISIAVGKAGTVWFGLTNVGFSADLVGRLTEKGDIAEYRVGYAYPTSIAVGPERNLWFRSGFGRRNAHLVSIDAAGNFTKRVCAEDSCELEPTDLTAAPDGSLWYGLASPNLNEGGGGSGFYIAMGIANEAGLIAHLVP